MKTRRCIALLSIVAFACFAPAAAAADRVRAGQWIGTTTFTGGTRSSSNCLTQADADAMNGSVRSIRAYLEKIIPPAICKLTDIAASGNQVAYTSVCGGAAANAVMTTYHGDSLESTSTNGTRSEANRVGACK